MQPSAILKQKKFNTPRDYYNQLLSFAEVNEKGLIKVESYHLTRMIEKCTTAEDIDVVFEAYYNLIGHRTKFQQTEVDLLVRKSVECKNIKHLSDLLKYNRILMYYPHPQVLEEVIQHIQDENLAEELVQLGTVILDNETLKLSEKALETLMNAAGAANNNELVLKCHQHASKSGVQLKGGENQRALIQSAYESKKAQDFKNSSELDKQLARDIDVKTLDVEEIVKLAGIQLPDVKGAVDVISHFLEIPPKKNPTFILDSSSEVTKEFITKLLEGT
eukprot:CAMPEP_0176416908 /NCGR_PEP_ID=MMETSP0127-20121128/6597_1 /TAXON_ID=938130 /ORGANISM="Platyophrya macrostoma, Strain WH" /LENGTH=275 /DNA_ID=CAMNT_0017797015 /DNA_START=95 /DNA_END=918 /DNA_ORIENTATION=+